MKIALIANGLVTNIIVAGENYTAPDGFIAVPSGPGCIIGATWDGETFTPPAPPPGTGEDVNAERARRIVEGTMVGDIHLTGRDEDARNLQGLAFAAQLRLGQGDNTTVTVFRDGDNVDHELTPMQVLGLWQAGAAYVSAVYAASWALKAMDPIPADFVSDTYWP